MCVRFLCQMDKGFRGLGILDQTLLTSWLLWAKPVAALWLLLLPQKQSQNKPHFTWFVNTLQVDFKAHLILLSDVLLHFYSRLIWTLWIYELVPPVRLSVDFQADWMSLRQFLCHGPCQADRTETLTESLLGISLLHLWVRCRKWLLVEQIKLEWHFYFNSCIYLFILRF